MNIHTLVSYYSQTQSQQTPGGQMEHGYLSKHEGWSNKLCIYRLYLQGQISSVLMKLSLCCLSSLKYVTFVCVFVRIYFRS